MKENSLNGFRIKPGLILIALATISMIAASHVTVDKTSQTDTDRLIAAFSEVAF